MAITSGTPHGKPGPSKVGHMFDKIPFLLCLILPALIVGGILAVLIVRAPEGRETDRGFETVDRTPKG